MCPNLRDVIIVHEARFYIAPKQLGTRENDGSDPLHLNDVCIDSTFRILPHRTPDAINSAPRLQDGMKEVRAMAQAAGIIGEARQTSREVLGTLLHQGKFVPLALPLSRRVREEVQLDITEPVFDEPEQIVIHC